MNLNDDKVPAKRLQYQVNFHLSMEFDVVERNSSLDSHWLRKSIQMNSTYGELDLESRKKF